MKIEDLIKIRLELSKADAEDSNGELSKIVKEGFPIPSPAKGEKKEEYVARCMKAIGGENKSEEQKLAICYAQLEKK
jgi:hypothetical protein